MTYIPSFQKNLLGISEKSLRRFEAKFTVDCSRPTLETLGPCWTHSGSNVDGYGIFSLREIQKAPILTHRLAYRLEIGPIPPRHDVHHKCDWPPCGRPEHLEALRRKKHVDVSQNHHVNATHCIHGHAFDESNTYYTKEGYRQCRECHHLNTIKKTEVRRQVREANPLPPQPVATHCPKGHEYTDDNMQFWKGERRCRRCKADWALQKYKANHEANKAARRAKWAENADSINAARRLKRAEAVESSHA